MELMGRRLPDNDIADDPFQPGTYGRVLIEIPDKHWEWRCTTPNNHHGNLSDHTVIEHEDKTITVEPSILITGGKDGNKKLWHGWLTKGKGLNVKTIFI